MSARVCIVDYGVGNRRSVEKALNKVGIGTIVSSSTEQIGAADGLVIPGVGAFPPAIARMRELGLDRAIIAAAERGTPILGACLGMQLLFDYSDEHGGAEGLGLLAGNVVALKAGQNKLPHIGWSAVEWSGDSPLASNLTQGTWFYHVHSYVAVAADPTVVIGRSTYGGHFTSVVAQNNIYGVQFHPEKSSADGLRMLSNFGAICEAGRQ